MPVDGLQHTRLADKATAVFLRHDHLDDLPPARHKFAQRLGFGVCDRPGGRANGLGEMGDRRGVQAIGLGEHAGRAGATRPRRLFGMLGWTDGAPGSETGFETQGRRVGPPYRADVTKRS